jgi:large conductance mechanosensitive channel
MKVVDEFKAFAMNSAKKKKVEAPPAAPPAPSKEEILLTEIRDLLKK